MLRPELKAELPVSTTFYRTLPQLIEEVLRTTVDPVEVAAYEAQASALGGDLPARPEWREHFDLILQRGFDESARIVLQWIASQGTVSQETYLAGSSQLDPKRQLALPIELQMGGLITYRMGTYEITSMGREFLHYLDWRLRNEGLVLPGGEVGI